jgi:hypothetical protein
MGIIALPSILNRVEGCPSLFAEVEKAPLQIDSALLQIHETAPFLNRAQGPFPSSLAQRSTLPLSPEIESIVGMLWNMILTIATIDFIYQCVVWSRVSDPGLRAAEIQQRNMESNKKLARSAVFLTGTCANTLSWAHSVGRVVLDGAAPFVKGIGYGTTIFISFWDITDSFSQIESHHASSLTTSDSQEQELVQGKIYFEYLSIGSKIASIAWAFFSVASLFVEATVLPILSGTFLCASFILTVLCVMYKIYLKNAEIGQVRATA